MNEKVKDLMNRRAELKARLYPEIVLTAEYGDDTDSEGGSPFVRITGRLGKVTMRRTVELDRENWCRMQVRFDVLNAFYEEEKCSTRDIFRAEGLLKIEKP